MIFGTQYHIYATEGNSYNASLGLIKHPIEKPNSIGSRVWPHVHFFVPTMSTPIRKTVSDAANSVARSSKPRRLSSASRDDDVPPRPTKRAKISREPTMEESQTSVVARAVAEMGIESQDTSADVPSKAPRTARKKKVPQDPTPADYPPRTHREWKVGAHISAAGGIENAILNAAKIG